MAYQFLIHTVELIGEDVCSIIIFRLDNAKVCNYCEWMGLFGCLRLLMFCRLLEQPSMLYYSRDVKGKEDQSAGRKTG